jgi:hypothetical protein
VSSASSAVSSTVSSASSTVSSASSAVSSTVSSASSAVSEAGPLRRPVHDSIRDVAVVIAAFFAASASRPVIWSRSALTSLFPSTLALCSRNAPEAPSREPANMLPTVMASLSFLDLPSR